MKAVITTGTGKTELRDVPVPILKEGHVLVRVETAAQNPTDWRAVKLWKVPNAVLGNDFAGVITKLGPGVDENEWKIGDRVASMVHGGIKNTGSYAEYLVCPAHMLIRIPDDWTYETAAQLGVCSFTAAQVLWESHILPKPFEDNNSSEPLTLLVWSGASATGQYIIQYAKLSGMKVLATASPKHFDRLKSLGAEDVFDYKDPEVIAKIRSATGNKLKYVADCISDETTYEKVQACIGNEGGVISCILPYPQKVREGIQAKFSLSYSLLHEPFQYPLPYTPDSKDKEFGQRAAKLASRIIANDKFVPLPVKLWPNGLAGVPEGLEYMEEGKVSGEKITYRIQDTPGL